MIFLFRNFHQTHHPFIFYHLLEFRRLHRPYFSHITRASWREPLFRFRLIYKPTHEVECTDYIPCVAVWRFFIYPIYKCDRQLKWVLSALPYTKRVRTKYCFDIGLCFISIGNTNCIILILDHVRLWKYHRWCWWKITLVVLHLQLCLKFQFTIQSSH